MFERGNSKSFVHPGLSHEQKDKYVREVREHIEGLLGGRIDEYTGIEALGSRAHEDPETFANVLMSIIDFEHGSSFSRSLRALDLMIDSFDELGHLELDDEEFGIRRKDRSSSFAASELMAKHLVEFVRSQKGNYVMHVLAQDYLAEMKRFVPSLKIPRAWNLVSREKISILPPIFMARPRQFGCIQSDGSVGLSDPEMFEEIQARLADIEQHVAQVRESWSRSHPEESSISGRSFARDNELRQLCTYETIEAPVSGLPPEALFSPQIRLVLEKDFGISIADLHAREQEMFLQVLGSRSVIDIASLKNLTRAYGLAGARSFLAVLVDPFAEREIIALGSFQRGDTDRPAAAVFKKFSELISRIDSLEDYLRATFGKDDPGLAREVTAKTLLRARQLIGEAHAAAERGTLDSVLADIENLDVGTKLFVDVCRSLNARGELDPTQIPGSQFVSLPGGSFKGAWRRIAEQMEAIQFEQYGPEGARYSEENPELYAALNDALRERIESPEKDSRFQIFLRGKRVVGFFRLDEKKEERKLVRVHLASVMGDPNFQGGKIIESLLIKSLQEITVPVYAECDPSSAITSVYLRRMGFVAVAVGVEKGMTIFRIERPASAPENLERAITVEQIRERAKNAATESPERIEYRVCDGPEDVKYDLAHGAVLTHWEQDPVTTKTGRKFYARLRLPVQATE